jgi:Peptidase A4 family/Immunoglobulin I-set domain
MEAPEIPSSPVLVNPESVTTHVRRLGSGLIVAHDARAIARKASRPSIQRQPSNVSVKSGSRVSFVASAEGSPTPTIQWRESPIGGTWTTIRGATRSTYAFVASAKKEGYRFEAVFKNSAGSVTTKAAKLTVITSPLVTLQPTAEIIESGQPASFSADAVGSPKPTVRWQVSTNGSTWTEIAGATSEVYSFGATLGESGEEFEAIFKNSLGKTRTHVATLTVTPAPVAPAIVTQPVSGTVLQGATVALTAAASGSPAPGVQWLEVAPGSGWVPISGATSTTYSFAASEAESGYQFEAVFTNIAGSVTSSSATVVVDVPPVITAQPTGQTVAAGTEVSFSAAATGTPVPSMQWVESADDGVSWQPIAGETAGTMSFTATGAQSLDQFEAVFSSGAGTATSASATLMVTQGPTESYAQNWSGYADSAATFTGVSGTWTVPAVTCPVSTSYSSEWVGIDGFNSDATSVEQDGVDMDCVSGVPDYYAWYEMFGDTPLDGGAEIPISNLVEPGDVMSASVTVTANVWTLSINDSSTVHSDWDFSTQVYFAAQESSAEWIVERPEICTEQTPSQCSFPSLTDFGSTAFTNAQATSTQGSGPIDVFSNYEMTMLNDTGTTVLASPGSLTSAGTSFGDQWESSST